MHRICVSVAAAAFLVLAWVVPAYTASTRTLVGEYVYRIGSLAPKNNTGEIEAVFKPTGHATWDVAFYFTFDGNRNVYKGTAKGSLLDGELTGTVVDDLRKYTYKFKGTVKEGRFKGTHAQMKAGKEQSTGTMTMTVSE